MCDKENKMDQTKPIDGLIKSAESLLMALKDFKRSQKTRIGKWTIVNTKSYFKAVCRVDSKVRCVHLGKHFNPEVAVQKIRAWELENGMNDLPSLEGQQ